MSCKTAALHENISALAELEVCDIFLRAFQVTESSIGDSSTKLVTAMSVPLAAAGISIFNLSTYETDYVLVPESRIYDALDAMNKEFKILTEGLEEIEKEIPRPSSATVPQIVTPSVSKFKLSPPSHELYLVGVRKEMIAGVGQNMLRMLLFPQDEKRGFISYTETEDEVSIMVDGEYLHDLPADALINTGEVWKLLKVGDSPLGFTETGIVSSIAETLSKAGVSLFYVSTFNTDYVLVTEADADKAVKCLRDNSDKFII